MFWQKVFHEKIDVAVNEWLSGNFRIEYLIVYSIGYLCACLKFPKVV